MSAEPAVSVFARTRFFTICKKRGRARAWQAAILSVASPAQRALPNRGHFQEKIVPKARKTSPNAKVLLIVCSSGSEAWPDCTTVFWLLMCGAPRMERSRFCVAKDCVSDRGETEHEDDCAEQVLHVIDRSILFAVILD